MLNFFASCGLCSNIPSPGDSAYEIYRRLPPTPESVEVVDPNTQKIVSNFVRQKGQLGKQIISGEEYLNNQPTNSVVAGKYTFQDLINNNSKNICIRKIKKSNYQQLIQRHENNGQKFTDLEFPPEQRSIGDVQDLKVNAIWKRIPDIIKDPVFIEPSLHSCDVFQGSLGNAYFLSAISSLSQKNYRVKNLFPTLKLNRHGIYMARILYRGVVRQVVVDDYVPINLQGDPLFAKPASGRQIWIMILQKCWAKLHGSYGSVIGGLPHQVLNSFSYAPTFHHQITNNLNQLNDLWTNILRSQSQGAILSCSSKSEAEIQKFGLAKAHAYTILGLYESQYRFVKLRNPFRERQWRGRAGYGDRKFWASLAPAEKQRLGFTQYNQTVFLMLWEDFINLFDMLDICKLSDNSNISSVECEFTRKNGQMFEFETEGGNLTIVLSLKSIRGLGENIERKGYSRSVIIVGRQEQTSQGQSYKYIKSISSNSSQQAHLELSGLVSGKYTIFVKINWIDQNQDIATVSLYSQKPVHLQKIKQDKHFLFKVFLDHARNNPKKQEIGPKQWICNDLLLDGCGYGYLTVHLDQSSTRKLGLQIKESDYVEKRLVLKSPYKGKGIVKVGIEPGKELIILFRIKSQNFPHSVNLPAPKIYNLV